jgi:VWFA-related protein
VPATRPGVRSSSAVRRFAVRVATGAVVVGLSLIAPRAQQPEGGAPDERNQQEAPQSEGQQPTFRLEANFVRVDVFPTIDGKPVTDLTAADFEILEDGKPQKVETFEHVEIRGRVAQEERREPNSVAEGRRMAEDPRSRIFIVFLDTYHTEISGSHRMRSVLVNMLDRLIGPDDLFGVMTPEMSAAEVTLSRKTVTTEAMLSKYWYWGRRDRITDRDPEEQLYEMCFPEQRLSPIGIQCRDPKDPTGQAVMTQPSDTYAGVAREMIARRREKRVLDALGDLSVYLRGLREERKAIIAVSNGWLLFRPNRAIARIGVCEQPPQGPRVGVGPDGRITTDEDRSRGYYSRQTCETDRQNLANLDNWQTFRELLDRANHSNVSFYPIDSKGLAASDAQIFEDVPPAVDQANLRQRLETLQTLAEATDGLAVVNTNDLARGSQRIVDDLSSYYLLGYYSTNTKLDGRFREIKVRVKRPRVDVRARRGYRAVTEEEMRRGKEMTAAAAAAAPPSAVQQAIASLASIRGDISLRTHVSWVAAPLDGQVPGAKSHVWVVGEINPLVARAAEWAGGGQAEVLVTAEDGVKLAESTQTVAPSARTIAVSLADVPLAPGEITLRLRVRPVAGGLSLMDTVRFTIPDDAAAVGEPRILRRGPTTGAEYLPTADMRFRRTERLRVEVPVLGESTTAVTAELLDRAGAPMNLPVSATKTASGESVLQWATADLVLAPLAPGDYALRTVLQQGTARREVVTGFRIVP